MKKGLLTSKLDIGLLLLLLPYVLTIIWAIYGSIVHGYGFLTKDNYRFIGKDPILFIISSILVLIGFTLLVTGYVESGKRDYIYSNIPAIAFTMVIFNVISSIIIAWGVSGGLISGLSLVYSCQFIILYNFIITVFGVLMTFKYEKIDIRKAIKDSIGEILLVLIFGIYILIRVYFGPSFQLMLGGLIAAIIVIYLLFIRKG